MLEGNSVLLLSTKPSENVAVKRTWNVGLLDPVSVYGAAEPVTAPLPLLSTYDTADRDVTVTGVEVAMVIAMVFDTLPANVP